MGLGRSAKPKQILIRPQNWCFPLIRKLQTHYKKIGTVSSEKEDKVHQMSNFSTFEKCIGNCWRRKNKCRGRYRNLPLGRSCLLSTPVTSHEPALIAKIWNLILGEPRQTGGGGRWGAVQFQTRPPAGDVAAEYFSFARPNHSILFELLSYLYVFFSDMNTVRKSKWLVNIRKHVPIQVPT